MKKTTIKIVLIISILFLSFSSCEKQPTEEPPVNPVEETVPETDDVPVQNEKIPSDTIVGKWETEDKDFMYELLGEGTLIVRGPAGDDYGEWAINENNEVSFDFGGDHRMTYSYDTDRDVMTAPSDSNILLVRVNDDSSENDGLQESSYEIGKEYTLCGYERARLRTQDGIRSLSYLRVTR